MKIRLYQIGVVILAVTVLVVFPDCAPSPGTYINGKATGGGTLVKETLDGKAHFGFNGSSCSGSLKGHFNYNDKSGLAVSLFGKQGVMANGDVTGVSQCDTAGGCAGAEGICPLGGYLFSFDYRSNNRANLGTGTGYACLVDGGEGKAAPSDEAGVGFQTGPFADYEARGNVVGNVQGHLCDD